MTIQLLLLVLAAPAIFSCTYLFLLTLLSASVPIPARSSQRLKFDVIVPAHNESAVIARTRTSLQKLDWPQDGYRILVVCDNCDDDTAAIVRRYRATAIERQDPARRGKGYALQLAFTQSAADGLASAVVVIDADTEVSPNLLEACAARLEQGARGVQVHYGVLNPDAAWRTRLIAIAKSAFHIVRSRARERLGLSCGLRGNGWCVTHELLRQIPYAAYSLTEDVEFGIVLGLAGVRIHYADEAHADAEMASGAQAAGKQRERWEQGRFQLIRTKTWPLLVAALKQPSWICLDLALDLLVLPLSYVAMNGVLLLGVAVFAYCVDHGSATWVWVSIACCTTVVLYVLRGWQLSGTGLQGLLDLGRAPGFLLWKLSLMLRRREAAEWVHTEREKS